MATNAGNAPLRTHYIYGLADPRDGAIRYIGRTCDPTRRLAQHCEGRSLTDKGAWIRELRKRDLRPGMVILEAIECDREALALAAGCGASAQEIALDSLVSDREEAWIARARGEGWPLL